MALLPLIIIDQTRLLSLLTALIIFILALDLKLSLRVALFPLFVIDETRLLSLSARVVIVFALSQTLLLLTLRFLSIRRVRLNPLLILEQR